MSEINIEPLDDLRVIREFNGAKDFYENSEISSLVDSKESVLASCSAGLERSNYFNSLIPKAGIFVPEIKKGSLNDPDFPINHGGRGISLNEMFEMLVDSNVDKDGLHLKYFDKPVNRLVLITGGSTRPMVDKIKSVIRSKLGNADQGDISFGVDIITEDDVKNFENKTREFVSSKKM